MKARLEMDVPGEVGDAVAPSLRDSDRVAFQVGHDGGDLEVEIESDSIGGLRGAANTALMLSKLSTKFMERGGGKDG